MPTEMQGALFGLPVMNAGMVSQRYARSERRVRLGAGLSPEQGRIAVGFGQVGQGIIRGTPRRPGRLDCRRRESDLSRAGRRRFLSSTQPRTLSS